MPEVMESGVLKTIENRANPTQAELTLYVAEFLKSNVFPKIIGRVRNLNLDGVNFSHEMSRKDRQVEVEKLKEDRAYLEQIYTKEDKVIVTGLVGEYLIKENVRSNLMKSLESIISKRDRYGKDRRIGDLIRSTLIFDEQVNEAQLLQVANVIAGVFCDNPITFKDQVCQWSITAQDVDPKFRNGGYSDLSLIFGISISGQEIYYENQVNTAEYITAKKIETPIYQLKKGLVSLLNVMISEVSTIFNIDTKAYTIEQVDEIAADLIKTYNWSGGVSQYPISNKTISFLFRKFFGLSSNRYIQEVQNQFYSNPTHYQDYYSYFAYIIEEFIIYYFKSKDIYKDLNGIIDSKEKAEYIKQKLLELPGIKSILKVTNTQRKRILREKRPTNIHSFKNHN